jgi:PadR family transcriptional regulator PadR
MDYMADFRKQFNKGVMELAVLKLLTEEDQYGYSIIQEVYERSNHVLEIKDGTLYPILYRLEDNNFIESYWETVDGRGKPRKYYKITSAGKTRFESMLEDYQEISDGINLVLSK